MLRKSLLLMGPAGLVIAMGLAAGVEPWAGFGAPAGRGASKGAVPLDQSGMASPRALIGAAPRVLSSAAAKANDDPRAQIGLAAAHRRLRHQLPTGRGVVVGQVEGGRDDYMPNITRERFRGVRFIARSGESAPFGHAGATGRMLYGAEGLAPGIDTVHNFSARDWITDGYLRTGSAKPPKDDSVQLFNHSWIANPGESAIPVLRRTDYQIDRGGVVMCVGVNNGKKSEVPHLLASAYNVIAVGARHGESSGGYTRIDGEGRCKPDLIAPKNVTSLSTPMVAGCAARLLEQAQRIETQSGGSGPRAGASRPEVIKAALLAGATKPKGWRPEQGKPLDEHMGAGQVNLNYSLAILNAGPPASAEASRSGRPATQSNGRAAPDARLQHSTGWDYQRLSATNSRVYRFTLNQPLGAGSLILTWHRQVAGRSNRFVFGERRRPWSPAAGLANFDLQLVRLTREGEPAVVAESSSEIDNVEHIYHKPLKPGRYRIKVIRRADGYSGHWPYALAWRLMPAKPGGESRAE